MIAGTALFPILGTGFGAIAGVVVGLIFGVVNGMVLGYVARWTHSGWSSVWLPHSRPACAQCR